MALYKFINIARIFFNIFQKSVIIVLGTELLFSKKEDNILRQIIASTKEEKYSLLFSVFNNFINAGAYKLLCFYRIIKGKLSNISF